MAARDIPRHSLQRWTVVLLAIGVLIIAALMVTANPLVVASLICTIAALGSTGYAIHLRWHWREAPGVIVRYRIVRYEGEHSQKFFHPVYRFTTADGQSLVGTTSWGSWRRPWPCGSSLTVLYCPTDPRRTELLGFNQWIVPATFMILAVWSAAFSYWFSESL